MNARILIVGMGGLGVPCAVALAEEGVGTLGLVDPDRVELSNLHRQVLYRTADVGRPKVDVAAEALQRFRPDLRLELCRERFGETDGVELVRRYDLVLEGTDSFENKFAVNAAAVAAGVPAVIGGILGFRGVVVSVHPGTGPCYGCVFEKPPPPGLVPTCREAGVIGAVAGVVGALMAEQAMAYVSEAGDSPASSAPVLRYDGKLGLLRRSVPRRRPECAECGEPLFRRPGRLQ